jgi:RNA-directed DNA polymerase
MTDTIVDGKVQRVQAMLYAKASKEPAVQFKRLYKYLTKLEWAEAAADQVIRNRGSRTAGIDGKTRDDYLAADKQTELVQEIREELKTQTYHPDPVRQTYIPKANGQKRPLGISTIKDRVVQQMVKMLLEPIYEAIFLPCSYGFRPNRCTWDALAEAYKFLTASCQYYTIIEGDIENCFGSLHHGVLMHQLRRHILDKRLLALIWQMLRAGVLDNLQYHETMVGSPQGSIVSPVLANVYLHRLDEWFHQRFHAMTPDERYRRRRKGEFVSVRYIRYCDDFIVMLRDSERAPQLKEELAQYIDQELKMTLNDEKTTIVHAKEGFDFLGVRTFIAPQRSNPTRILPYHIPSRKSIQSYRQKVKELTHSSLDCLPPGERIRALNWLISGWANYHRWGNAKQTFSHLSQWTIKKVHRMLRRYTPKGKNATYRKYFRPLSECTNLRRWKRYTNWHTVSVKVDEDVRLGILPMSIISTSQYWQYRGSKIPPAYQLLNEEVQWNEIDTEFNTDIEVIEKTALGRASRWTKSKYDVAYFHNRKIALQRDQYTCTECGYKSQRQKGEVHDLETHHINPDGGNNVDNLQTVCIPCHQQLTAIRQAD